KTESLMVVGDAGQAVLAPAVGARTGLVVAEVVPGVAPLAVVLPHGPPLTLTEVGPPLLPGDFLNACLLEADVFGDHDAPVFRLGWQIQHVLVMPRYGFEACLFSRLEGLPVVPGVRDGGQAPEVALAVLHDPLLARAVHVE